ncbi:hypothetical protein V5O48_005631 [Marasmius crinis-equi]|uniref:Uncharacterized protein n=1 Tax=Marasmius crinis-equi TaxID=585013 RepID=A0ABR3FMI8_9AGAR
MRVISSPPCRSRSASGSSVTLLSSNVTTNTTTLLSSIAVETLVSSRSDTLSRNTTLAANATLSSNTTATSNSSSTALETQVSPQSQTRIATSSTLESSSTQSTSLSTAKMSSTTSGNETSSAPPKNDTPAPPTSPQNNETVTSSSSSSSSSSASSSSTSPASASDSSKPASDTSSNTSSPTGGQNNSTLTTPPSQPPTSTMTSVVKIKGTAPSTTLVSTITDQPTSTLKSPVNGVVVTEADGHTTLSYPAFVTMLTTSQEPDGSFVTFTHTMANPTGVNVDLSGASKGFFQNTGAVAGTFLAVGVVLASMAICLIWMIRRRRRQSSSSTDRWIEDMQRRQQTTPRFLDDPFLDEPPMTAVDPRRVSMRDPDQFQLDDGPLIPLTPAYHQSGAPAHMTSNVQRQQPPIPDESPFSDRNAMQTGGIGVAITADRLQPPYRAPSPLQMSRQSSPSLYPPTDRDELEEVDLNDIDDDPVAPPGVPRPTNADASRPSSAEVQTAPPRPPRSILRAPSKIYEPFTPPPSDSNHSSSDSPITPTFEKPFERQQRSTPMSRVVGVVGGADDIFTRPTLLNVRPRSKEGENTK